MLAKAARLEVDSRARNLAVVRIRNRTPVTVSDSPQCRNRH